MRWVIRLLVGLAVLVVVLVGAVAVLVPRYVDTPPVREFIQQTSAEALGRPLQYERLSVGLLPPRLDLIRSELSSGREGDPSFFTAETISLRVALLPLLIGSVVLDRLVVDGLAVELVQDADGIWLPGPADAPAPAEPSAEPEAEAGAPMLAIRRIDVRAASAALTDRLQSPPLRVGLEALDLTARGYDPDEPLDVEASARLVTGGELQLEGRAALDGRLDLRLALRDVALAFARAFAPDVERLEATLSGEVTIRGPAAAPEQLQARLRLDARDVVSGDTKLTGPVALEADVAGDLTAPRGRFSVDATGATLLQGDVFRKPAAVPARVESGFAVDASGQPSLDDLRLVLHGFDARGAVATVPVTRVTLSADPFDLAGFEQLLPALADQPLSGRVALRDLVLGVDPLSVDGDVLLQGVSLRLPDAEGIRLDARISGRGDGIDLADAVVAAGGQEIGLGGRVRGLSAVPSFRLSFASRGVLRANPLVSALSTMRDTVYGPLVLEGRISGSTAPEGSDTALLDSLVGEMRFGLGKAAGDGKEGGRIQGMSVLGTVMEQAEAAGSLAKLASALSGGRVPDLTAYTGDAFELMSGDFAIAKGRLTTRDLRLIYRSYGVFLKGDVGLADLGLDMTGEMKLGDDLARVFGADPAGGDVVVPLARIGGSVESPKVAVHEDAFASLASSAIKGQVMKAVGDSGDVPPEVGVLIEKGLGGILSGGRKRKEAPK